MKKLGMLTFALALAAAPAFADSAMPRTMGGRSTASDDRSANNSFFVELAGPGGIYSVNYERVFLNDFALRAGFSYTAVSGTVSSGSGSSSGNISLVTVPVLFDYLGISSGTHTLELGFGGTMAWINGSMNGSGLSIAGSGTVPLATAVIGYRRQPLDGGFMFRIGVEGFAGKGLSLSTNPDPNAWGVVPWAYMSFGFSL